MNITEELPNAPALQDVTNMESLPPESDPASLSSTRSTAHESVGGQKLGVLKLIETKEGILPLTEQPVVPTSASTITNDEGLESRHTLHSLPSSLGQRFEKYPPRALRKRKVVSDPDERLERQSKMVRTKQQTRSVDKVDKDDVSCGIQAMPAWCRRCGCSSTDHSKDGSLGTKSLCDTCHLHLETSGHPSEGFNHTRYPPHGIIPPSPVETSPKPTSLKHSLTSHKKVKSSAEKNAPTKGISKSISKDDPVTYDSCHFCLSSTSLQWRKGPLGRRTLCNPCGLRWAKSHRSAQLQPNTPLAAKSIKIMDEMVASCTINAKKLLDTPPSIRGQSPRQSPRPDLKKAPLPTRKEEEETPPTLLQPMLRQRKTFLKAGMYSSFYKGCRTAKKKIGASNFTFPLPIHQGEYITETITDFTLPMDIREEHRLGNIGNCSTPLTGMKKPAFTHIRANIFIERKPNRNEHNVVCQCVPPKDGSPGCGEDCLNRMLFYECEPKSCPSGNQCSNQRFQQKEYSKQLQVYATRERGWGLRTVADVNKGDLLIEYRGEIISHKTCEERMRTIYRAEKNFYLMDYRNGEVIDACSKGTYARFINHSCEPNCHIEKWALKGELHVGVFASRDIPANTELFYDYNFTWFGNVESQQRCRCGSKMCRGTIGKRPGRRETRLRD